MAENAYIDLLGDILVALSQQDRRVPEPRKRRTWRQVRNVVDANGNKIGQVKLSKDKMIALKSPRTGQRLYRVKNGGWLLEQRRHSSARLGEVTPLTQEQARAWMHKHDWTYLEQQPGQPVVEHTARADERIFIGAGEVKLNTVDAPRVVLVSEGKNLDVIGFPVKAFLAAGSVLNHWHSAKEQARDRRRLAAEPAKQPAEAVAEDSAEVAESETAATAEVDGEEAHANAEDSAEAAESETVVPAEADSEETHSDADADAEQADDVLVAGEPVDAQPEPAVWNEAEIDWSAQAADTGWTVVDPDAPATEPNTVQAHEAWDDMNNPVMTEIITETTTTYAE